MNVENYVNEILREQLIEISLMQKNESLFETMTSPGWEMHLVCQEKAKEYVFQEKSYLEEVEPYVSEVLKDRLIELSLVERNEELFLAMTSDNWEEHLICSKKAKEYVFLESSYAIKDSFLVDKYISENQSNLTEVEDYIKNTTITDDYKEKKDTLHQLIMLSKSLNKSIYNFIKKIYDDAELINLLTFTSDKQYRNAVFYLDEEVESIKIKEMREEVATLRLEDAVEFYRRNGERFFIEIIMAETI